jgi:glycosyltransferase involved in cell wall biosynthesis
VSGRPIRLVQLVHGYPPAVGGVERSTRDLCEALVARHGFDVTVLTTDAYTVTRFHDASEPSIPIVENEAQNGVRVLRFPVETRWSGVLKQAQRVAWRLRLPGNDRLRTWYNGPRSSGLRECARVADADVICAASFPLNHMRYPFLRPEPQPPVVLVAGVHTNDDWGFERPYLLRLTRLAYATVAHTEHERDWLIARGAPPDRVRVIGHGIDPTEMRPRPGAFRAAHGIDPDGFLVCYVGQLGSHKGIDTLLRAFPALLERRSDAWLVVAGSRTTFADSLAELIADLPGRARERVRLLTDLDEQEKADVLGDSDVFASPSYAEAFGITTLEAWALRKPVVVGDAPSQRSIVEDGRNGLIVPYGDEAALLATLERLWDEDLRRALGQSGFERLLSRYRRHDVERSYAELFAEAAESARGTRSGRQAHSMPTPRGANGTSISSTS